MSANSARWLVQHSKRVYVEREMAPSLLADVAEMPSPLLTSQLSHYLARYWVAEFGAVSVFPAPTERSSVSDPFRPIRFDYQGKLDHRDYGHILSPHMERLPREASPINDASDCDRGTAISNDLAKTVLDPLARRDEIDVHNYGRLPAHDPHSLRRFLSVLGRNRLLSRDSQNPREGVEMGLRCRRVREQLVRLALAFPRVCLPKLKAKCRNRKPWRDLQFGQHVRWGDPSLG